QQHFIRKPMLEQRRRQRGATRKDKVRAVLRLDAANAIDDVRPKTLERLPGKTFRAVSSDIFFAAFIPSAIGLLGAFGQKPDQISYVRRPSSRSKLPPYAARIASLPAGVR